MAPALTAGMRLDAVGLDSLERVELLLQLGKLYHAKVPETEWSEWCGTTNGEIFGAPPCSQRRKVSAVVSRPSERGAATRPQA